MALDATDWTVDHVTGNIRYIGDAHGGAAPTYATVLELHRWLQDLADDAQYTGDDKVDITALNPSKRYTDNYIQLLGLYNIDATAQEHLYDGSLVQGTGGTEEIFDGIVNFGNASVKFEILQNGSLLTNFWDQAGGGLNPDANAGISHRFCVKTRNAGADIDGRRMIGLARTFGKTYSEFKINGTNRGNNVLALSDVTDNNNATAVGTVATWTTITNTNVGYNHIDVNNDGVADEYFYSAWDKSTYTINQFYERMKYLVRTGTAETLYGLGGGIFRGITHELQGTQAAGTFVEPESLSWTGGTGQLLACDSTTAATKLWMQILTGVAPSSGTVTGNGGATFTVSGNTERAVSSPFCGSSTGSALLGAYGFGVEYADLTKDDRLVGLDGVTYTPPNNVTFTVSGLVVGEDRVLVGPWDGVTLDSEGNPAFQKNQFTLNTTLLGATETAVVVTTAIPNDTPGAGTIRVELDSGLYRLQSYTSWTGSTFTIPSTDYSGANQATAGVDVFISYIDKLATSTSESFTGVFVSTRNLVILVRDGDVTPIQQYITSGQLTSTGGGVSAIRTTDA